jgi:integrase
VVAGKARARAQTAYTHVLGHPRADQAAGEAAQADDGSDELTPGEVASVLQGLDGTVQLVASFLYGAGLRLLARCTLRVQELELDQREIAIRRGKGRRIAARSPPPR